MADKNKLKAARFERRRFRSRTKLFGSPERPRLSVFRSDKHIYAQLIDDFAGKTLAAVSSTLADVRGADLKNGGKSTPAQQVGAANAQKAQAIGITKVALHRGGRVYQGRI